MILYIKFKEIFNNLDDNFEPEIKIHFKKRKHTYMIIKYKDYVTFQRCGLLEEQSGEIRFNSLDELSNTKTIDDILLIDEWEDIDSIDW